MSDADPRPSPDALLREAARESRGALKIFLGAAPGVGKTYEMLSKGAEKLAAGVDVVIGVVETHGRAETEALLAPLELIPRRSAPYRGQHLTEMDLDAILARAPALVLVDELAHTNSAGSRHPKRWQDIDELRDAGIDVWTTVNIQHLESLNDVVGGFTQVRVRETVPDRVFEDADIEVIDLSPDDLITRLKEGKIYLPQEAGRALENFFTKTKLSALRELALRRAAQAVDQQMLDQLRASGVTGTWAAGERVLVAVSEEPGSAAIVRAAKRLADALRAPWTAVHVETPREGDFSEGQRRRVGRNLALAAELGATLVSVPGSTVSEVLIEQVAEMRATQLVIGKSHRSRWFQLWHGSVVNDLLKSGRDVAIHVIPMPARGRAVRPVKALPDNLAFGLLGAASLVGITAFLGKITEAWFGYQGIDLLFLVPVMVSALLFGRWPSIVSALMAGTLYNFLFLPPVLTFNIYDPRNVVTVFILIAVGLVTSQLAVRLRIAARMSAKSARENAALARFAARLGALSDAEATGRTVCEEVAGLLSVEAMMLARGPDGVIITASEPAALTLNFTDRAAAKWALDKGEATGVGTNTLTASAWQFRPLRTGLGVLGVLALRRPDGSQPIPADQASLAASLVDQAALAHERLKLENDMSDLRATRERDSLRAALLASLSHDLRTPLTGVIAAAEALEPGNDPDGALVRAIRTEARRLNSFLGDLLDVTRIEEGAVRVNLQPIDLTDVVRGTLHDLRGLLQDRKVIVDVDANLPLLRADPVLLQHALLNLVDNANKYSAPDQPIEIFAKRRLGWMALSVRDHGAGLPEGAEKIVFERFFRGMGSDRTGGAGLGLAIVKGFADAMGLEVRASNAGGGGARFTIAFPPGAIVADVEGDAI
jgi:two-component system, OmpR family, sensor histidine kinase KdpD